MAHGQPDYGMYSAKETIGSIADNAELAARLGSIVTFDRKGDVIWLDTFEGEDGKWETSAVGVGASYAQSNEKALRGSFSAKLVTGAAVGNATSMKRVLAYPILSNLGFEIAFNITNAASNYIFQLHYNTGALQWRAEIRWNVTTQVLEYLDAAGAPQTLDNVRGSTEGTLFHILKLVINSTNHTYHRLILDSNSYDMSNIAAQFAGDGAAPHFFIYFEAMNIITAVNKDHFVDCVIATQNEP